jgi:hypothetical protein
MMSGKPQKARLRVLEPNTPAPQSTPEREQTAAYIAWRIVIIVITILMGIFGLFVWAFAGFGRIRPSGFRGQVGWYVVVAWFTGFFAMHSLLERWRWWIVLVYAIVAIVSWYAALYMFLNGVSFPFQWV